MSPPRNSLQNKLILFLLVAIVIPISISIVVTYQYTKANIKEAYIRDNATMLYQGSYNLINYLNRINQTSLLIYQEERNSRSLYNIVGRTGIRFADQQDLYVNVQFLANSLAEVKQIAMYMEKSDTSFRFAYNLPRYASGRTYEIDFPDGADVWLEPTHMSGRYGIAKFPFEQPEEVISIHRRILNEPTDQILGTLSIDVRTVMIREIGEMLFSPGEQLYLVDRSGAPVYVPEQPEADSPLPWLDDILARSEPSGVIEYADDAFAGIHLYQSVTTPFADWMLVKRVPYDRLYQGARELTVINSLIVGFFLIVAAIGASYVSLHFTSPIKRLIQYINKLEAGQLDAELELNRADEIGILARRFHQLMQRLNQLINREYRLELANRTNELKALQAQVNPHFLNNALQSIGTLALQHNEKKIYSLISSLGKMMRYQMNTGEMLVPFAMEVDYVRAYLDLQSHRFGETLRFRLDVSEEAKRIHVPRMMLQPIVENCFKHGFGRQANAGDIMIAAAVERGALVVRVEDNGSGIDPDRLASLQARLSGRGEGAGTDGIGLINVSSRLRLYFGQDASIALHNREPNGLAVTLTIPVPASEEENRHESAHRGR